MTDTLRRQRLLSPPLVFAAVTRSRGILDLHDDWDGEGSRGYTDGTLEFAVEMLESIVEGVPSLLIPRIETVELLPGPDGSVDLELVLDDRRLLINVPHEADADTLFYGHGPDRQTPIKGAFGRATRPRFLAEWLVA